MENKDGLGCLDQLIACTGHGRIILHGENVNKKATAVIQQSFLDVVASQAFWIWHSFFGLSRSDNDLNVLSRSSLFSRLVAIDAPPCKYVVNACEYMMGYYHA